MAEQDFSREANLLDLFMSFWSIRRFWLSGLVIGCFLGGGFQYFVQNFYEAHIVVGISKRSGDVGLGQDAQNGANLRYDSEFDFLQYQQILVSVEVVERLLQVDAKRLRRGISFDCKLRGCRVAGISEWDVYEISDYLKRKVRVYPVGDTGLRSVRYRHTDIDFAQFLLSSLDSITNDIVRERAIDRANKRLAYLKGAVSEVVHPDHRRVFADLLLQQERELMMAKMDESYAAQKVVPVTRKGHVVWPRAGLFFAMFVVSFFVLSVVVGGMVRSVLHVD